MRPPNDITSFTKVHKPLKAVAQKPPTPHLSRRLAAPKSDEGGSQAKADSALPTSHWAHLNTTTHSERLANRNAGFIRQNKMPHGPLPDKSGVPVVVSRCAPSHFSLHTKLAIRPFQ